MKNDENKVVKKDVLSKEKSKQKTIPVDSVS